jgi:hypothetical protein
MLSVALLAGVLTAGLGLLVAAASGDGSSGCWTAYSDSLQSNRRRLAGIDHLVSRYDLPQADDPLVRLMRAKADDPLERLKRRKAGAGSASNDIVVDSLDRIRLRDRNPFVGNEERTDRARVVASLDALKRQGADSGVVDRFLREYEQLSPLDDHAPTNTRRPLAEIVAAAETRMTDSIWYDTAHLVRSARLSSIQCFKSRAGLAVALPALAAFVTLLFAVWWSWFGGRTPKLSSK